MHRVGFFARTIAFAGLVSVAVMGTACSPEPGGGGGSGSGGGSSNSGHVTVGTQTIAADVPEGQTLTIRQAEAQVPAPPAGVTFPSGAIDLDVSGVSAGAVVTVQLTFTTKVDGVRKLIGGEWDLFRFDGETGVVVAPDGLSATLHLKDGGRGDTDGAANGTVVDPFAPTAATTLTVTSNDLPTPVPGQPYSVQLHAAGAAGPVTWTVVHGSLPEGLTMDPDGLITGTNSQPSGGLFVVRADDGVSAVDKLLLLALFPATGGPVSTGAPLPDGSTILTLQSGGCQGPCSNWAGLYRADGSIARIDALSPSSAARMAPGSSIDPQGNGVVVASSFYDGSSDPLAPAMIADAETGAPVATLDTADMVYWTARFSPDGTRLLLAGQTQSNRAVAKVFDAATWQEARAVVGLSLNSPSVAWSPDSTAVAVADYPTGSIRVISLVDATGASDRSVDAPVQCTPPGSTPNGVPYVSWAGTDRFVVSCSAYDQNGGTVTSSIVTMTATDGSNSRVVHTSTCAYQAVCTVPFGWLGPTTSPTGTHMVVAMLTGPLYQYGADSTIRLAVLADEADAPFTYLTEPAPAASASGGAMFLMPYAWT